MDNPNKTTQHNGMVLSQEGLLMDSCVIIEQAKHRSSSATGCSVCGFNMKY